MITHVKTNCYPEDSQRGSDRDGPIDSEIFPILGRKAIPKIARKAAAVQRTDGERLCFPLLPGESFPMHEIEGDVHHMHRFLGRPIFRCQLSHLKIVIRIEASKWVGSPSFPTRSAQI